MIEQPKWTPWRYGWGEDLKLRGLPVITVAASPISGEGFYYQFGDIRSKPVFKSIEDAKSKALSTVRTVCEGAVSILQSFPHS